MFRTVLTWLPGGDTGMCLKAGSPQGWACAWLWRGCPIYASCRGCSSTWRFCCKKLALTWQWGGHY